MSVRTIDVAYEFLKENKGDVSFKDLWQVVKEKMGYSDTVAARKISQFYTDLSIDGRFAALENNHWDLKTRVKYEEINIEDGEDDEEDQEEIDNEPDVVIETDEEY